MHLAWSTKHALLALGIGVTFRPAETTPRRPIPLTPDQVSTDIKIRRPHRCHSKGTTQPFSHDKALAPAPTWRTSPDDGDLIDKTTPANSVLIMVGRGIA